MITPTLAQEVSRLEADLCFALSDPTRILILYAIGVNAAQNVNEITAALNIYTTNHFQTFKDPAR